MAASNGTVVKIGGVDIVHWNPRPALRSSGPLRRVHIKPRVNNFGDLIGPRLVQALVPEGSRARRRGSRLITVGSILHFAKDGDTVWGSGVNGKMDPALHAFTNLDVRAVRGPLTREFLLARGIDVPAVYGDPALLLPELFPELREIATHKKRSDLVVLNLNDSKAEGRFDSADVDILNPRTDYWTCLETIASSEYVVSTSLHGVIVAEALGIPARLVVSASEHSFKYEDYFRGTGRPQTFAAETVGEALSDRIQVPALEWDSAPLRAAFPSDLWSSATHPEKGNE